MKSILAIFRKDVRHLWPQITAYVALILLNALLDPTYTHHQMSDVESWIEFALPIACAYLVTALIHEERLPGDRQYWLTRPFSRAGLFAAKALFMALLVNLPVFVCHSVVLKWMGIPLAQHLAILLVRQVFLSALVVLPFAALASITSNLKQVILAVLLAATALLLLLFAPWVLGKGAQVSLLLTRVLSGDFWLRNLCLGACALAGCLVVLLLQYRSRATGWSRGCFAAALLLCVAAAGLPTPENALAIRGSLPAVRVDSSAVQIASASGEVMAFLHSNGRRGSRIRLEVPVRVSNVPARMEWLSVKLNGRLSSVPVDGELSGSPAAPVLTVVLDRELFDRLKLTPVDLTGSVELALFERRDRLPAPKLQRVAVPGIGSCATEPDPDGKLAITCYSTFPRVSVAVEFPGGGRHWIVGRRSVDAPIPTSVGFQVLERYSSPTPFENRAELEDLHLVTERPAAVIEREFALKSLRLPRDLAQHR